MNKYRIISLLIGAIVGVMVGSNAIVIKLLGIGIVIILLLYFRKDIKEVFLSTEADKIVALLLIAILGAGIIILDIIPKTLPVALVWGAWVIFCIFTIIRLSTLVSEYECASALKDIEIKWAKRRMEPSLTELFVTIKRQQEGKEPRQPNQKEKEVLSKHNDIVSINYEEIPPRATICHLRFRECYLSDDKPFAVIHDAYGIAVRTKTDKEDPEFAEALAFKRAIKSYLKKKRAKEEQ